MDGVPTSISKLTTPTPSVKRQDTWKIYVGIIVGSVLLLLTIPLVSTLRRKWIEKR